MKDIFKAFGIDCIYGVDWETYWAADYTLSDKKRGTTEYVTDKRFESQLIAVQKDTWDSPRVMETQQFRRWAMTVDWNRSGFLAHHAHFDGLIASHHFGIKPRAYFDTLSMARPIMPVHIGGSLKMVCKAFGRKSKQHADALVNTKGKLWAEFTKAEKTALKVYAGDDIEDCWYIFNRMRPFFTMEELRLIDLTVKMYAQPSILLDAAGIESVLVNEHARKTALLEKVGVPKTHLTSKPKFAELLRAAGVEPPTKVSKKQSEKAGYDVEVLAMSKQDQEFKDLVGHPSERVRDLIMARFDLSSNQMVSRCNLLASRCHLGPQPVYLNYYGAKTGRWSGSDNANWQNLSSKRKEGGAELRASVYAPPGYMMIIADLAQIEARIVAWFAGQHDKVDAFRAYDAGEGPDVYRYTAANTVYHKPIDEVTDMERFIGKTCIAEGELVLTDAGLVPIEQINTCSKVWDGVEWVSHDGVVCRGERSVITYQGLTATPDHEVFLEDGRKICFGAAASQLDWIAQTGFGGKTVRLGQSTFSRRETTERISLHQGAMRWLRSREMDQHGQPAERSHERLPSMLKAPPHPYLADQPLGRSKATLHKLISSVVEKLRSAWYYVRLSVSSGSRGLGVAASRAAARCGTGPSGQQQGVRSWQPALGYSYAAKPQSTSQPHTRELCIPADGVAVLGSYCPQDGSKRFDTEGNTETSQARGEGKAQKLARHQRVVRVYDIINAGPRRRFTVNDLLVSNCELALGFQAGWKRFAATLRIGAFGPPVNVSDSEAKDIHSAWRAGNPFIVADWRKTQNLVLNAFMGKQRLEHGVVAYEGKGNIGWMHLPGGMAIRYDDIEPDEEGKLSYISKYRVNKIAAPTIERTRLYGGIEVENRTQALARRVIGEHMLDIVGNIKTARIAMSTHDEIVTLVPTRSANRALATIKEIMSTPPSWARDLPLAVDAHISARYDK